ncbi:MAG: outer membrane lipoprotein carrier protein LolA [Anaerolineae bacterium]
MEDPSEKDVEQLLRNYYQAGTRDLKAPRDLWERVSKNLAGESKSLLKRWSLSKGPWFTRLHIWGEVLERGATLGMLALFAFLAITTFFFIRSQSRLREPGATPAAAPTLTPQPTPTPTPASQPTPTPTPTSAGIGSFEVVRVEHRLNRDRTGMITVESHHWYQGPTRYRKEWRQVDPPQPDSELLFVMDGEAAWTYNPAKNRVAIQEADPDLAGILPPTYYGAKERLEMINAGDLYTATLVGTETIAGREAYLLELRPKSSMAVSSSDPDLIIEVEKWWLDVETDFELKYEQYTTEGLLVTVREVTYIAYNLDLPDELFTFKIPEGAIVIDQRSGAEATLEELQKQQLGFAVFIPTYLPPSLSQEPEVTIIGPTPQAELFYSSTLGVWLRIIETDASDVSSDLRGEVIDIGGIEGRLQIGDGVDYPNTLIFVKGGTYIALWSLELSPGELRDIAESMR